MVDLVSRSEAEQCRRYEDGDTVIQLPSGARQRIPRSASYNQHYNMSSSQLSSELRRRKVPPRKPVANGNVRGVSDGQQQDNVVSERGAVTSDIVSTANTIIGYIIMIILSYQFSKYLCQIHDNELWFTEIMVSSDKWRLFNVHTVETNLSRKLREKSRSGQSKACIIPISNSWYKLPV